MDSERQRSRAVSTKVGRLSPKNKKIEYKQTGRKTDMHTDRQMDRQTCKQTGTIKHGNGT